MILRFLHWVASHGRVYDFIQVAAGGRRIYAEVAARVPSDPPHAIVLDIGGGTGTLGRHLHSGCRYICLDLEEPKLRRFRQKVPGGMGLLADGARLPLPDGSVDTVVCAMVAHHLPEAVLKDVFAECQRVLRAGGRFIFLDWLRRVDRLPSRILCALDRGAHPYVAERLQQLLENRFEIDRSDRLAIFHEYLLMVLRSKEPDRRANGHAPDS